MDDCFAVALNASWYNRKKPGIPLIWNSRLKGNELYEKLNLE